MSFLNVFWEIAIVFAWIFWIYLLITVFGDLFRRHDIGGGAKFGWIVFVMLLPYVGAFIYLVSQGHGMAERRVAEIRAAQAQGDAYIRETAGGGGPAAEIDKARQLLESGAITQAEFDAMKAKALAA